MHTAIKCRTSGNVGSQWRLLPFSLVWLVMFLIMLSVNSAASQDIDGVKDWNMTHLDRLRAQLFTNYDRNAHPLNADGSPTKIKMGMSINYVDIDELNSKMTTHMWLNLRWMDSNRSWNASEYGNITQVHMKAKEVWRPQITLFNTADAASNALGNTQVLAYNEGSFLWVPPAEYVTYCNLNLQLWPYDKQTCKLKIGSWTLIDIEDGHIDFEELVQSTEWQITDTSSKYQSKDVYNYMEYTIVLQRRSTMYAAVIFTPASCIVLLALATFWLPPQMGEKLLLNGIIIVVIATFLMYFAQLLPILAENTPLIVLFYSSSLLLLSISTIIAVIVLYLATAKHKRRIPEFLKNLLNGPLGNLLCLTQFSLEAEPTSLLNNGVKELCENVYDNPENEVPDPLSINPSALPSARSIQFDWILLATAVDRISFLFYCLVFIVLAIVYSV